jgi:hypothetical protein
MFFQCLRMMSGEPNILAELLRMVACRAKREARTSCMALYSAP